MVEIRDSSVEHEGGSLRSWYEQLLWGSMDFIGVRDNIERKFMSAVVLQYVSAMALFFIPVVFLGPSRAFEMFPTGQLLFTGLIATLATVAFLNTILVVRRDILTPIVEMKDIVEAIGRGQLDTPPSEPTQRDEIGALQRAHVEMYEYLTTIANQADALRREQFDAAVLEEKISGELGDALGGMQQTLQTRIRDLRTFREAIEQVGTGIAIYDSDGTVVYANRAYATMLGTEPETMEGDQITEVNPDFESDRFEEYWQSFEEGDVRQMEATHRRFDTGAEFPVSITTTRVGVEDQQYNVGTIEDISQRKERERRLRELHEATRDLMTTADRDDVADLTARAARDILGYGSAVVRFHEDEQLVPVAITERAQAEMGERPDYPVDSDAFPARAFRNGDPLLVDDFDNYDDGYCRGEARSAMYLPIDKYGVLNITDASPEAFEQTDINLASVLASNAETALTRLEREREMRRQNDRLEKFGRTVAHDLRNPLNVIEAHLETLMRDAEDDETHQEIREAVDHMTDLIEELLELAKHGKTVIDPSPEPLDETVRAAWNQVDTGCMSLEIEAEREVFMDQSRVQQVFENLFRNAREHAGADATVRVATCEGGFIVEDDGPGIPDQIGENVFQSGYTTDEDGTGYGLAIVKQIADAHDWTISVPAGSEGGARFEFRNVEFS